jgi:hypothetical protein
MCGPALFSSEAIMAKLKEWNCWMRREGGLERSRRSSKVWQMAR